MRDIFDILEEEDLALETADEKDSYVSEVQDQISGLSKKLEKYADDKKKQSDQTKSEVKKFIKSELAKIPVTNIVEKIIEKQPIKETIRVEVPVKSDSVDTEEIDRLRSRIMGLESQIRNLPDPPKKDSTRYVEESKYLDLLVKISKFENQLKETRRLAETPMIMPGGSGVIGIPPPEPNPAGYVLTVNSDHKAQWKVATASGGGSSSDVYTTSNVTTKRTLDPTTSPIDDLYNVLASLIVSLQGAGIIQ